jgi:hypothetical protein
VKRRCALALLAACSSPTGQGELEQRVAAAAWEGWERAGLPDIDERRCQTARFEVNFPDDEGFADLCYPHTVEQANGCLVWRLLEHRAMGLYSIRYPVAVVDPMVPTELVEGLVLHELMHALVYCALRRPWSDPYDHEHSDARVWIHRGTPLDSAEEYARESLAR